MRNIIDIAIDNSNQAHMELQLLEWSIAHRESLEKLYSEFKAETPPNTVTQDEFNAHMFGECQL